MKISNYTKGSLMCLVATLMLTTDTLLVRSVSTVPDFTVSFVKFIIYSATSLIMFIFKWQGESYNKFMSLGWLGLLAGIMWGFCNICFVTAVQNSPVANVLVIVASNSIFSSIFSFIFLKEALPYRTVITCLVCFGAVILVFSSDLTSNKDSSIVGNLLALGASLFMAIYFTMIRYAQILCQRAKDQGVIRESPDMIGCNVIAGIVTAIVALIIGGPPSTHISVKCGLLLWLQGGFVSPVSFGLLTIGPQYLSAPEVSLYFLFETILGPVWVFLAGYERPPLTAVYGGIIIVVAIFCNAMFALREERLRKQEKQQLSSSYSAVTTDSGGDGSNLNNVEEPDIREDIIADSIIGEQVEMVSIVNNESADNQII